MDSRRIWCLGCCIFLLAGLTGFAGQDNSIDISTPAFEQGKSIPVKYAEKGENVSPGLRIGTVPTNTRSLVLIIDDLDAPTGIWTHWLVWNLPADTTSIPEGKLPAGAIQGKNSFGRVRYDGPVPPSGTHRYFIHIFAIDTAISLPAEADRAALDAAMKGHVLGSGVTFGVYSASL